MTKDVFIPIRADGYEFCHPIAVDDFESINELTSAPTRAWRPVEMEIIREDNGEFLLESDSPWLGSHALIFRGSALGQVLEGDGDDLEAFLRARGELCPLRCSQTRVELFRPPIIDALDEALSAVVRFPTGRIMMVDRYVFREDVLAGVDLFMIPNLRVSPTFVSGHFVERWKTLALRGLEFQEVASVRTE